MWYNHFRKHFLSFIKVKYIPILYQFLGVYAREKKHMSIQHLYMNVHNDFICNTQNYKHLKCPSTGKLVNSIYSYNGTLPSNNKEQITDIQCNMDLKIFWYKPWRYTYCMILFKCKLIYSNRKISACLEVHVGL